MTSAEKQDIYNLLKTCESWACGYVPPDFSNEVPVFEDDVLIEAVSENNIPVTGSPSLSGNDFPVTESSAASGNNIAVTESSAIPSEMIPSAEKNNSIQNTAQSLQERLESVSRKIYDCHGCILSRQRKNAVPGEGCISPAVMVIGEGPGEDEDIQGRPFVGKAGQLLDKMLYAIELDRNCNCYIANIVKCRPPMNRTPMPDEAAACQGFLEAQIHLLKPKMILAMGRTAIQNLLKTSTGINQLRGKMFEYHLGGNEKAPAIPILATYHPSALLRDPSLKRPAWEDLKTFKANLLQTVPDYAESFYASHPETKKK